MKELYHIALLSASLVYSQLKTDDSTAYITAQHPGVPIKQAWYLDSLDFIKATPTYTIGDRANCSFNQYKCINILDKKNRKK